MFNRSNTHFIAGHHGVGKTYLVNTLKQRLNGSVLHLECGPAIRSSYKQSGSPLSYREWETENLLEHCPIIFEQFKKQLDNDTDSKKLFISGSRAPVHINYFAKQLEINKPSIIFLDSVHDLQKRNYENREKKQLTDNEFLELINRDKYMGLDDIKTYATENPDHCSVLYNYENDIEYLVKEVFKIFERFGF